MNAWSFSWGWLFSEPRPSLLRSATKKYDQTFSKMSCFRVLFWKSNHGSCNFRVLPLSFLCLIEGIWGLFQEFFQGWQVIEDCQETLKLFTSTFACHRRGNIAYRVSQRGLGQLLSYQRIKHLLFIKQYIRCSYKIHCRGSPISLRATQIKGMNIVKKVALDTFSMENRQGKGLNLKFQILHFSGANTFISEQNFFCYEEMCRVFPGA